MKKIDLQSSLVSLKDIYNLKDDYAKGRLISLGSALMTAFYNVFITGIFYTGFLSMYDISITGVGIISFIPYIASCLSVFSSMILERFKQRKKVLLVSKLVFYGLYIIATTLMPQFVIDPHARLVWFIVIVFAAHAEYALFSPGFTPWFYVFYPQDNERRTRYIVLNQIFSSIMSSTVLIVSALITDAVSGSEYQNQIILGFRYFAFLLVIIDVAMQACAREFPYPEGERVRLNQVFTLPFKYRKFLCCMILMFVWNYVSNLNNGLWNFHLLNHMNFSYTLINTVSVLYTVILILTSNIWKKLLARYSWIKTFGIACILWMPTEICFFFMTINTTWMYLPLCIVQNVISVGFNLSYANVLYMNLPEENSTAHIAFYTIGVNLFAFLGLLSGTYVSGITGDATIPLMGIQIYSVQFTTLMRGVTIFLIGLFCTTKWRLLTRDQDIAEVEAMAEYRTRMKTAKSTKHRK